jgi:pimeloyl-ACP methyl ester carboxylesterase
VYRRLTLAAIVCSTFASSCYRLRKEDIFAVPFTRISATTLAALSDQHHHVRIMRIPAARSVSAYWDQGDTARGVLIFFDGNGYGAEAALRRLLVPSRALGLDLIAFNYYDQGQPRPSMAEMRRIGDALYDAASELPTFAGRRIYLGGHSLGATFALATAIDRPASGLFLAAPVTTGVAMVRHQLPFSRLIWLRPDSDYKQFNNLVLAPNVHTRTIVFGSDGDKALPPTFTNAVYRALSNAVAKKEVILPSAQHSEYFAQEQFWREISDFFGLPSTGPFVGYIR